MPILHSYNESSRSYQLNWFLGVHSTKTDLFIHLRLKPTILTKCLNIKLLKKYWMNQNSQPCHSVLDDGFWF